MIRRIRRLYFTNQFFYSLLGMALLFTVSFFVKGMFLVVGIVFWLLLICWVWDLMFLHFGKNRVEIERHYPEKLSNGDDNHFELAFISYYPKKVKARVLEEFPMQLQIREKEFEIELSSLIPKHVEYELRPTKRGIYEFGRCHVLVRNLGFFERKFLLEEPLKIPCYPSFIQLRKYQLMATTDRLKEMGIKRIRKIGSTLEFDHVREYVRGDEYRFMNWKASAKHKKLMVNQYQEEKSQPIYSFIDTGRAMRMPFNEMTLLDYSINSVLVLSNAAILKQDRAGMLTFSNGIANHIPAEKRNNQMQKVSEALYSITTLFEESEFGKLYAFANKHINKRSLIFVYTNFETMDSLNRQMPYLKMINKTHIVVVVVFKNTELIQMAKENTHYTIDIYNQIIAEKFVYEKSLIIQELNRQGIQTIYTAPEQLTINSINKYLEIKARGLI